MSPLTLQLSAGDYDACHPDRFVPLSDEEVRVRIETQSYEEFEREQKTRLFQ